MSVCLPLYLSAALSLCRFVRPSVCLSADLSVSASTICLSVCTLGKLSVVSAVFMCRYTLSVSSTAPGEGIHSATSLCLVSFPRLKVSSILSITRRRIEVFCCLCAGFVAKHRNDSYFRVTLPLPLTPTPLPISASTTLCLSRLLRLRLSVARPVVSLVSFRLFAWLIVQLFS